MDPSAIDLSANRTPLLMASTWAWTSVAILFVTMRFYCRISLVGKVWWDDAMILLALCCSIAVSIVWTVYANYGGTRHAESLTTLQRIDATRLSWISQPLCVSGLVTGKLSVALLIGRLQSPTRWRTVFLWVMCIIMFMLYISLDVTTFVQCTPTKLLWNPASDPNGHCIDPRIMSILGQVTSAYLAVMDICLAALPVHMIWGLQIPKKKKIAICILLSTGVIAFAFAMEKIIALRSRKNRKDETWASIWLFVWNAYEINIVIVAACIPTLVPLFEIAIRKRSLSYFNKKPNYSLQASSRLRNRFGGGGKPYIMSDDMETGINTTMMSTSGKGTLIEHASSAGNKSISLSSLEARR